jgi:lipid-binding SYLF domain-containing protein
VLAICYQLPSQPFLDAVPLDISAATNSAITPETAGKQNAHRAISNSIFTAKEEEFMLKRFLIFSILVLFAAQVAVASDREDDTSRTRKAAQVFKEIMDAPDQGIPHNLLQSAKCIAIIPGDVKFAFIFGGNYGRGVATCRTSNGWSAPMFVAIDGGSVGYQIGGSSTDLIMLFMNEHALHSLLSDKFKLGADASVAAGPVGRKAAASTDLKLNAEILSYSRSKGIFAGVSLNGAVVQADKSGDQALYGDKVDRHNILDGKVPVPDSARILIHVLQEYSR